LIAEYDFFNNYIFGKPGESLGRKARGAFRASEMPASCNFFVAGGFRPFLLLRNKKLISMAAARGLAAGPKKIVCGYFYCCAIKKTDLNGRASRRCAATETHGRKNSLRLAAAIFYCLF